MRIIVRKALREFWEQPKYADSKEPLEAWHYEVKKAEWDNPADIKAKYCNASILKNNQVVFNIAGNKYRLVVEIKYVRGIVYIRFIGTHKQYNKIDAEKI
ncbi:MAG: type II toxin-antitoxin system HigB family toxin [Prochloron sp. SP5CPC1]|nr:type II toxin-antitoxin system HigB family toxin [Candidatus Paraprochloron terpiosi SP5CPC1]